MANGLNPGAKSPVGAGVSPDSAQQFQDLLAQGKQKLAQNLVQSPTPLDRLGEFAQLYATGTSRGTEAFNTLKQQQTQNRQTQNEQLRALLAQENEQALQVATHALNQQIQQGDIISAELANAFSDTDQGQMLRGKAARLYGLALLYEMDQNPSYSDDDDIPLQRRRELARAATRQVGSETHTPGWIKTSRPATEEEKAAYGVRPGQPVELIVETNPNTGEERIVNAQNLGPAFVGGETETEESKLLSRSLNKLHEGIIETQEKTRITDRTLGLLKASLNTGAFETGFGGETRTYLSQLVEFFGGDPTKFPGLGDAATAENIQAAADQLAIERVGELSRVTNMSIMLTKSAGPSLLRTVRGNKLIVELMIAKNERDKARAIFANEYVAKHRYTEGPEGNLRSALDKWDKDNPAWSGEDDARVKKIAREGGPTISEALGDISVRLPRFFGEVDRMEDREVISFFRNLDDETWLKFQETYPEVAEYIHNRYISLTPE